jgi:hypothetical protein
MSFNAPNPDCDRCKGDGVVYEKQASNFFPGSIARVGKICPCMKSEVQKADIDALGRIAYAGAKVLITFKRKLENANA